MQLYWQLLHSPHTPIVSIAESPPPSSTTSPPPAVASPPQPNEISTSPSTRYNSSPFILAVDLLRFVISAGAQNNGRTLIIIDHLGSAFWPSSTMKRQQEEFDYWFKLLLIGDSGVGKSSLLLSYTSDNNNFEQLSPTIGVDFKIKYMTLGEKKLKLVIWDTAGQERFRTLTSSYYRGAQGIIMVYDVTRRETFTNLSDIWAKEIDLYSTNQDCIKMLIGNKVDKGKSKGCHEKEGSDFARECGCIFLECSAKTRQNVEQCFEELVAKIMERPSLLAEDSSGVKKNIFKQRELETEPTRSCCSYTWKEERKSISN
ncbi:ras-related protein RABC1-like [Rutidosis leptorrhynchoides]|uniref:ras-related protein RABC1-like n=1 Tax=Rutidosis leptorrhynchoides TaxID=125765 RepID=UPI003A9A2EF4